MRVIEASWLDRLGRLCACAVLAVLPLAANAADEDPWEGFNRPVFSFNDTLDTYALKPVAKGYQAVTPQFFEDGIHNVFRNIGDVTNLANNLLQGKVHDAGVDVQAEGYAVARRLAESNLKLGLDVVADCVNPVPETREAWRAVAGQAGARLIEVEIICSAPAEHRRRVETRITDLPGFVPPTWQDVIDCDYRPWDRERLVIDTATTGVDAAVAVIRGRLSGL